MGRPKQLLPYRDGTIIEAVLDAVLESSVDGLCVVANHDVNEFLGDDLPERCVIARNNNPQSEMVESVRIGMQTIYQEFEAADDDGVMVLLADQPQVSGGLITTCAEAWRLPRKSPPGILIATYRGRRGHPTVFTLGLLKEIDDWPASRKLNELARQHADAVRELPITTAPMPLDINTPEDYDRLQES